MSDSQVPLTAPVLLNSIIEPALSAIGLWSPAAGELLLGTAAQESGLRNIRQVDGPALGLFQMEPATHDDCWRNFLVHRPTLSARIRALIPGLTAGSALMETSDVYACAMARIKYLRVPEILPPEHDLEAQADYYKRWYNTVEGAATAAEYVAKYQAAMGGQPSA